MDSPQGSELPRVRSTDTEDDRHPPHGGLWPSENRAIVPVVGTVLLVAVVSLLGATMAVGTLAMAEPLDQTGPTAAFESEQTGDSVQITQIAGETIDTDRLSVRGADEIVGGEGQLSAGDTISVTPTDETIRLIWTSEDGAQSSVLYTTDAQPVSDQSDKLAVPDFSQEQREFFRDRTLSDPFVIEIHAVDSDGSPYTGTIEDAEIVITDHLGSFNATPENRYYAYENLSFDANGTAELTFGNTNDADVYYEGIDVNEITGTIEIDTGSVESDRFLLTESGAS